MARRKVASYFFAVFPLFINVTLLKLEKGVFYLITASKAETGLNHRS